MNFLPIDVISVILTFIQPQQKDVVVQNVRKWGRSIVNLSKTSKNLNSKCQARLTNIKIIYDLIQKYTAYDQRYSYWKVNNLDPKGNPHLLDALSSGYILGGFPLKTFKTWDSEILKDIKNLIRLTPQSIHCILGELRCRQKVPPLAIACLNENIPIEIIKLLLENGMDPNAYYSFNGLHKKILPDLEELITHERFMAILDIFKRYGYQEEMKL